MNQYFLNRKDYSYELYKTHGLSNEKYLAAPKDNGGTRYVIKSAGRDCACNEFMGLHLSKLMGVNVPDARLMLPKHGDKMKLPLNSSRQIRFRIMNVFVTTPLCRANMFIAYWPTACLKIMILVICFIPPGTCTHVILQKGVILMIFRSWLWRTRIRMDG